ncbi:MAG TPA: AI-2E family transporter [Oscillatoriales cyanobacterium M59_W2019_021]|nr:AI-2E family transporter [Oscillatoriales cyanobacterium M59_W2019_021]
MPKQLVAISLSTIAIVTGVVLSILILWQLQSLLVILMISVVLAASLAPIVDGLERYRVPRWLGTILAYLGSIGVLTGIVLLIGPTASQQIERLTVQLPVFVENLVAIFEQMAMRLNDSNPELLNELIDPQALTKWAIGSSQQLVLRSYGITRGILGAVASLFLSLFISGYMVADSRTLTRGLVNLFPQPWKDRLAEQVKPVGQRMGGYIRGRVLVSTILAIGTTTGLSFLGMPEYALGLGAIAGITNLIPFLGPILGAIPAIVVALSKGGLLSLWVLILFVVIQNVETYVLDPLLVGTSVGVHPLYQLLAVIGGAQLLGILGALIVPPWVAGGATLLENLYLRPKLQAERLLASPGVPPAVPPAEGNDSVMGNG